MFFKLENYSTEVQEMMPENTQMHSVNMVHCPETSIVFENLRTKLCYLTGDKFLKII